MVRLYAAALITGISLFLFGWYMGQHDYRHKVAAALKAGEPEKVATTLAEWCKKDPQFSSDPMYYLSCASLCLATNRADIAKYNIDKAIALMGE